MAKKIKRKKGQISPQRDLGVIKENLEKTGEALGDLFTGIFKGVGRILDVAQEMEKRGEKERTFRKGIKGFTKSGKEFRGEAGWRIKTGIVKDHPDKTEEKSS